MLKEYLAWVKVPTIGLSDYEVACLCESEIHIKNCYKFVLKFSDCRYEQLLVSIR